MYRSAKACQSALLFAAIIASPYASARGPEIQSPISRNKTAKRPITVADAIEMTKLADEDYFSSGTATGEVPHFSPDGKQFVIVLRKGNIEQDTNDYSVLLYWTSDAFGAPKPDVLLKRSTSSAYRGAIRALRWLDNETLAFLGETATEPSQVYTFEITNRLLNRITNHPTAIQSFDITKDGHEVIYSADAPMKVTTDQERREGIVVTTQPLLDLLAGELYPDPKLFVQRTGKSLVEIPVNDRINFNGPISISPDGRYTVIAAWPRNVPSEWMGYQDRWIKADVSSHTAGSLASIPHYLLLDTNKGSLTPLLNAPMRGFNKFFWTPDSQSIILKTYLPLDVTDAAEREARSKEQIPVELNLATGKLRKIGEEELQKEIARTEENQALVTVKLQEDTNTPPKIYVSDPGSKRRALLLDLNPQFSDLNFGRVETISWKTAEGYEMAGGLYLPPDYEPGKRYPLVIQTHGFTTSRFSMDGTSADWSSAYAARMLAAKGFVVAQMGSFKDQGLDEKFVNTEMEGPSDMSTIEGLIDSLRKRELIDPNRVGISGFSRTVYSVGYTLTHSHYKFGAVTLVDGISGGYFDYLAWGNTGSAEDDPKVNGGPPFGERLQLWLKNSPGFNLDKVNAPVRIVALNKGSVLSMWQWFCGLFLQNKPVDFIEIPDSVHLLRKPSQRRIAMQGMVDWFSFWLTNEEDPDPAKAAQYERWRELRKLHFQK